SRCRSVHFSQDSPCHSILDLSFARCPRAGESGSAPPNRHPSAVREKTPEADPSDRMFWVGLSRIWRDWRSALAIVKPETVVAWHRAGFGWFWTWKVGRGPTRTASHFPRGSRPDPQDVPGKSRLGCTPHPRGVGQTRPRHRGEQREQVHGALPQAALA